MLSDKNDGACLRPLIALRRMQREADFVAHLQFFEPAIGDRIAVEVDLHAIAGVDEAVVCLGNEAGDPAMRWNLVRLHVAPPTPAVVLELAPNGVEAIPDGDLDVFVGMVLRRIALHNDLLARDLEIDPDVIEVAVAPSGWAPR
jgi:hypothetical protein